MEGWENVGGEPGDITSKQLRGNGKLFQMTFLRDVVTGILFPKSKSPTKFSRILEVDSK